MWLQGCTGILKILQGRDNAVTRLWQGCDKLVTIQSCEGKTMWLQGCRGIVNILQDCDKVVARL